LEDKQTPNINNGKWIEGNADDDFHRRCLSKYGATIAVEIN